jgi:hypothetical protein
MLADQQTKKLADIRRRGFHSLSKTGRDLQFLQLFLNPDLRFHRAACCSSRLSFRPK